MQDLEGLLGELDTVELEASIGYESLREFSRMAWPIVEPGVDYVGNWHLDAIDDHLEALFHGDIRNLLINMPPRSAKSTKVAVIFPAWCWVREPSFKTLFSSYSQILSTRDSVKCRRLVQSEWYQKRWGEKRPVLGEGLQSPGHVRIVSDQNVKTRYETNAGGLRFATSVGGAATGDGGDLLACDDPHNVKDVLSDTKRTAALDWWDLVWQSRLNNQKTGRKVVVMQRTHDMDLSGYIMEREPDQWTHLNLEMEYEAVGCVVQVPHTCSLEEGTAIGFQDPRTTEGELLHPQRTGPQEVAALKGSMTAMTWAGQYQQRPTPREGAIVKAEWLPVIYRLPIDERGQPQRIVKRCRAWDLAATEENAGINPSWTVGLLLYHVPPLWIVADVIRVRESAGAVRTLIKKTAKLDGRATRIRLPQDPGQAGKSQASDLVAMLSGYSVTAKRMTGSKPSRAEPWVSQAEFGHIRILHGAWNSKFVHELTHFPGAGHDDQWDAMSDAFDECFDSRGGIVELRMG